MKGKIAEMKLLLMKNSTTANLPGPAAELVDAAEQYRIGAETLIKNLQDQVAFLENQNQLIINNIVTKLDENIKFTNVKSYKDALSSKPTNQNLISLNKFYIIKKKIKKIINPSQLVIYKPQKTNFAFKFIKKTVKIVENVSRRFKPTTLYQNFKFTLNHVKKKF
ncbi:hypothetical protein DERP_001850 [Dermatophagoides pteronyssinus]|uniref:Uncharacterized protein n=1 Tax=Dermatophagoides pteronyssinus TaxID=6956 RepID=A0ABQ8JBS3_DERPT|nr:hypothetical protein DERP_001850 [Dermatophagoides pteronyssinus]